MEEDRKKEVRNIRLAALVVALVGGVFAVATGTWRDGVLGLSISLAVALFGVGERVKGRDRAVGLALIIAGVIGVLGHVLEVFLVFGTSV